MEVIKKGSVEPLLVSLRDRLENILTLATVTGLVFDVKSKDEATTVQSNVATTFKDMTVICLITTTLAGYVAGSEYNLYLKFSAGSESPVLGPVKFRIE